LIGGEESAFEGEGEGVEGGLPSVHPAWCASAGGVEASHDKVEALEGGLLVGEMRLFADERGVRVPDA
jgi:hypothetical protein